MFTNGAPALTSPNAARQSSDAHFRNRPYAPNGTWRARRGLSSAAYRGARSEAPGPGTAEIGRSGPPSPCALPGRRARGGVAGGVAAGGRGGGGRCGSPAGRAGPYRRGDRRRPAARSLRLPRDPGARADLRVVGEAADGRSAVDGRPAHPAARRAHGHPDAGARRPGRRRAHLRRARRGDGRPHAHDVRPRQVCSVPCV